MNAVLFPLVMMAEEARQYQGSGQLFCVCKRRLQHHWPVCLLVKELAGWLSEERKKIEFRCCCSTADRGDSK